MYCWDSLVSGHLGPLLLKSKGVWGWFFHQLFKEYIFFLFVSTQMVDMYLSYLPMKRIWWKSAVCSLYSLNVTTAAAAANGWVAAARGAAMRRAAASSPGCIAPRCWAYKQKRARGRPRRPKSKSRFVFRLRRAQKWSILKRKHLEKFARQLIQGKLLRSMIREVWCKRTVWLMVILSKLKI